MQATHDLAGAGRDESRSKWQRPWRCWNGTPGVTTCCRCHMCTWARRAIAQLRLNDNEMVLGGLAGGVHSAWYAALFACGAGDGNRTRTVSLGTAQTHGHVLGSLRVSR